MLISIDHHNGVPVYRQLMDQIKFHIASGLLRPGDELPSTRVLSAQLGVNPMTISKSYSFLEKEQVVERRRGMRLVVRALDSSEARSNKLDQLRLSLASSVTIARQCGIENTEAVGVFRELLQAPEASDGRDQ